MLHRDMRSSVKKGLNRELERIFQTQDFKHHLEIEQKKLDLLKDNAHLIISPDGEVVIKQMA